MDVWGQASNVLNPGFCTYHFPKPFSNLCIDSFLVFTYFKTKQNRVTETALRIRRCL